MGPRAPFFSSSFARLLSSLPVATLSHSKPGLHPDTGYSMGPYRQFWLRVSQHTGCATSKQPGLEESPCLTKPQLPHL